MLVVAVFHMHRPVGLTQAGITIRGALDINPHGVAGEQSPDYPSIN
jgi:hypothetical protein